MVYSINIGGKLLELNEKVVMSIVNITTDSFYGDSRIDNESSLLEKVEQDIIYGAKIIDIGGYSSRPGASDVPLEHEIERILWAVGLIRRNFGDVVLSIDTFRSQVVQRVFDIHGPFIVNDITAGEADSQMFNIVGKCSLPYIAMHMRGTPQSMADMTDYQDMMAEILSYFAHKVALLRQHNVKDIIIDPGVGFAKTVEQNFHLLYNLSDLKMMGLPILVGLSRKSLIYKTLKTTPEDSLAGTIALNWEALSRGADILRVHDVKECAQTINLFNKYRGGAI